MRIPKIISVILSISCLSVPVNAAQQLWATTYVDWQFDAAAPNAWMIEQDIWIPVPGLTNYFTFNWNFTTTNNGYMGIQPDQGTDGKGSARFSIWNSLGARNGTCSPYDHEGSGYSCTIDFTFDPKKFFRLRLARLENSTTGQWWGAWIIEQDDSGNLVGHLIGEIQAQPNNTEINTRSIGNFSEYWGQSVAECKDVSMSVVGWGPPKINYHGGNTGVYDAVATKPSARTPPDNICVTGTETQGAFHNQTSSDLSDGIIGQAVVLGGAENDSKRAMHSLSGRDDGEIPMKRPSALPQNQDINGLRPGPVKGLGLSVR